MPDVQGPWDAPPPGGRLRILLWLTALALGAVVLRALFRYFPAERSDWDWGQIAYLVALLLVVSTGVLASRRYKASEFARNIGIWVAVGLVLVVGYAFKDDLDGVWTRVKSELVPGSAVESSPHVLTLTEANDGHFYVYGEVQGARVRFLIDTGASDIVLSPADARRAGFDPASLSFYDSVETANGFGRGARIRLVSLAIGPIVLTDVPASVNRADMSSSLLGMAFLRRLDGFEIHGRQMLLHWH